MALRKQINKDVPSESQQMDEDTQEDEDLDDKDELSSSLLSSVSARGKRRKEREHKTKSKDMTEEEMMDLALRLSEQEASVSALRQQQEEEAVMKAIQESMVSQTQPCPPSQSQSLLPEAEASLRLCSRRKLSYSNGETASASEERSGTKGPGDENNNRNKKRKRKEGSPLLEMPDLSQASPCSSESPSVLLDSPQSCDSTQIDDCQLRKSPVFPSTGCRAEVHVPRLSQNLLETCRTSGFVLFSQDSSTTTQKSPSAQHKSPTFPKSSSDLALSESTARPKSPVFSETAQGDVGEVEPTPEFFKSPVFGRNTQHEKLPSACKPTSKNSGFMFSSQESFSSSGMPTSCRPKSPVFPRNAGLLKNATPSERSAFPKSPVSSETERGQDGQTEQSHGRSTSPALCRTERRQNIDPDVQEKSATSSAAELRDSNGDENPPTGSRHRSSSSNEGTGDPALCVRQDKKMDHSQDDRFNKSTMKFKSVYSEELNEASGAGNRNSETELTSDMTLHWSDEDEDVTPVGSPSPVFPEERLVHEADGSAASQIHVTAASPGTNGPNCSLNPHRCVDASAEDQSSSNKRISLRPSTSSTSACQQQEPQPISSQGVSSASSPPGEPAGRPTVHYYWGVPFCPRGLDPDSYTQVILAQMEVYEKSLKRAQRCLLRKAEWGEAVLPEPEKSPSPESPAESPQQLAPRRRGLRLRGRKLSETADSPPAETEEEEDKKEEEEEEEERGKEERTERKEGKVDTDDCEVCPETQLSDNDSTQDLLIATDDGAVISPQLQPKSPEQPEVEMILQVDSPARNEAQEEEEMEVDAPAAAETEGNKPVSSQNVTEEKEDRGDPDVEEIKDRRLPRSKSPELEPVVVPQSTETNVDCPICQRSFPATEIEMHAAYCDGEVAVMDEKRPEADCYRVSLKPRRKRTRRAAEEPTDPSDAGGNQEKCFICQKAVPLRDYGRHTELCIQQQAPKTAAKGNLLSALQKTERGDSEAGPSGSRLQPGDVIDLRDDDDDEEEGGGTGSRFRISNSPIRSFTPISEATGCLIDFKKQQQAKKPSQRRR
ncbi:BRCA1-A complex subunit RAP80 isoform X1 [Thunnus albacares]|uniref:BRCA1-A complex subunit RAP80 isoform X1 n=1 Tax=Thunnus albacares TaxID=8236 RepID=UPI001CF67277|nr:BRCA1-A complex subunit RAP80 isoform X1 [Thunnus albacares]XP_044226419.1 BRCA1-A complex subunit RAP80 isoform X1 [Thunnus albacares]XP_044226420.1 BRCA1-A complex subunit RAP80 isoform X1 [Thunnus albacares]